MDWPDFNKPGFEATENKPKPENLVGKLTDVKKGDRVRIWRERKESLIFYEACGYVTDFSEDDIVLSTSHPLHIPPRGVWFKLVRDNRYNLKDFTNYAIQEDKK